MDIRCGFRTNLMRVFPIFTHASPSGVNFHTHIPLPCLHPRVCPEMYPEMIPKIVILVKQ
jgi:hypothetical protein